MDLLTILFVSIRVTPVDLHLIQFTWIVFNSKHKLLNFNQISKTSLTFSEEFFFNPFLGFFKSLS